MKLTAFTADFQSSQNYLLEFLLLDTADLLLQSSYRLSCLTVKNHVVEKTGPCQSRRNIGVVLSKNQNVGCIGARCCCWFNKYLVHHVMC